MDMSDYTSYLQPAAAVCSAIAAFAAVYVARSNYIFQKQSLLKKMTVEQMQKLLHQLHYLKSLTRHRALSAPDDEITRLRQRISETNECFLVLESMISDSSAQSDLKKVSDFLLGLDEYEIYASDEHSPNHIICRQLDEAIGMLQKIYRRELK